MRSGRATRLRLGLIEARSVPSEPAGESSPRDRSPSTRVAMVDYSSSDADRPFRPGRGRHPGREPGSVHAHGHELLDRRAAIRPGSSIRDRPCPITSPRWRPSSSARGGLGGIALTHDHADHARARFPLLRERFPDAVLAAGRGEVDVVLHDGLSVGPLEAVFTPGHAPDHFSFIYGSTAFTGDAVLGQGSVFIAPDPGALAGYSTGLAALRRREPELILPRPRAARAAPAGQARRVRGPPSGPRAAIGGGPRCGRAVGPETA